MTAVPLAPLRAAILMLASSLSFGLMAINIRLASQSLDITEVAFFRNVFGLLALLPMVLRPGRLLPYTRSVSRYLVRTIVGLSSMLCEFWSIGHLPLSQAISLSYSTPLFVTIAAVCWLGEKVHARRWLAVIVGFIGVLVILRPGSSAFSPGLLVALAAASLGAIVAIQIKQLSRQDAPNTMVFYTYLFWIPMSLLPALLHWHWPHGITWLCLLATGIFGTGGQMAWTRALKLGEVSALQPISFMQLPVVIVLGCWLFGERLDAWTAVGATIILAATAYIAHREALMARHARDVAATSVTSSNSLK